MKYNEQQILKDLESYIKSTYEQHYNSNGIQVNDLVMAIGHGEGAYVSNAIEYLARYGKKDGKNVKDLYKAIHNIMFLIHLNHMTPEQKQAANVENSKKVLILEESLHLIEEQYNAQVKASQK